MFQESKIKPMLRNPKSLAVVVLSSVYALFMSFRPALSADIYCPDGAGTVSITINGVVFPVPPEWPIQSVMLDTGTSGASANYYKIFVIQRFTKSGVPDRHTTLLIGASNNVVQFSHLYWNQSISDPRNCLPPAP
jgi:hypothetical protein